MDFNQVCISNLYAQLGAFTNTKIELDLFRGMVLNSVRAHNSRFRGEYGQLVIAADARGYWRKTIFPYYKAHRKKDREDSDLDWNAIFQCMDQVREELAEFFPYPVVQCDNTEADDVIATLIMRREKIVVETPMSKFYGEDDVVVPYNYEKVLILSSDKDFRQLQAFPNVKQFDPINKKFVNEKDPKAYLLEHIISGDRGDGIPNVLSDDDTFVKGKRQKPLTEKRMAYFKDSLRMAWTDEERLRFDRNAALIDMTCIPDEIQERIISKYQQQSGKNRQKLFSYFISKGLKGLMTSIQDF